jgi:hypothetical protein
MARSFVDVNSIQKKSITPHLFITFYAVEGHCVAGGAESIFWSTLGSHQNCTYLHVFSP